MRLVWVYAQENEERMRVEHELTQANLEAMGIVMEATGGVCGSKVMQAQLARQTSVGTEEIREAGVLLGQLVRRCQWLPRMRIALEEARPNTSPLRSLSS